MYCVRTLIFYFAPKGQLLNEDRKLGILMLYYFKLINHVIFYTLCYLETFGCKIIITLTYKLEITYVLESGCFITL